MDEPLSSLDAKLRNDLRLELKRIQQDLGATMLYVTHDQIEATLKRQPGIELGDDGRVTRSRNPDAQLHGSGRRDSSLRTRFNNGATRDRSN